MADPSHITGIISVIVAKLAATVNLNVHRRHRRRADMTFANRELSKKKENLSQRKCLLISTQSSIPSSSAQLPGRIYRTNPIKIKH